MSSYLYTNDPADISTEISAQAASLQALGLLLVNDKSKSVDADQIGRALFAASGHLARLADIVNTLEPAAEEA